MSTQRKIYKNHQKRGNNPTSNSTSSELASLIEMFPDWEAEDLSSLLDEHNNLVEIVIDLIVNNKVSRWEPIKKEKHKKKEKEIEEPVNSTGTSSNLASFTNSGTPEHAHRSNKHKDAHSFSKSKNNSGKPHSTNRKPHAKAANKETLSASASATSTLSVSVPASSAAPVSNTWAATLSKDKPKPTNKTQTTNKIPPSTNDTLNDTEDSKQVNNESQEIPASNSTKPVLKEASVPQPKQGTWASAITPKPKAKPEPAQNHHKQSQQQKETSDQNDNFEQVHYDKNVQAEETSRIPDTQASDLGSQKFAESNAITSENGGFQSQPHVVLPVSSQQVDSIGVSFGSLALGEDGHDAKQTSVNNKNQIPGQSQQETQRISQSEASQAEQIEQQAAQPLQQAQVQQSGQALPNQPQAQTQSQQQQRQRYGLYNQNRYEQQGYQQQQQYNQSKQPHQLFDYYNQFQQSQQYPQQATQTLPGAQFGIYPGIDYSAYNQQVAAAAAAAASVNSPAASPATTAAFGHYTQASQAPANNTQESNVTTQSPIAGQINPTTLQQQVPAAPFGYPYYNYYYNTPFYGNGATLGAQSGFGSATPGSTTAGHAQTSGFGSGMFVGAASNAASQYYAQPSQNGNRYPGYGVYPNQSPVPSQATNAANNQASAPNSQGDANDATTSAQANQTQIPQQAQPQHPIAPEFAAYQQYPQYGAYQENSQYRGWY